MGFDTKVKGVITQVMLTNITNINFHSSNEIIEYDVIEINRGGSGACNCL